MLTCHTCSVLPCELVQNPRDRLDSVSSSVLGEAVGLVCRVLGKILKLNLS